MKEFGSHRIRNDDFLYYYYYCFENKTELILHFTISNYSYNYIEHIIENKNKIDKYVLKIYTQDITDFTNENDSTTGENERNPSNRLIY